MNYNLIRPCANCPFRNDIRAFLRPSRAAEIAREVLLGSGSFACHKTIDYTHSDENDGEPEVTGKTNMCAGALIFAEHCEQGGQMIRIAARLGLYDPDKLDMASPVYTSEDDFIGAQMR